MKLTIAACALVIAAGCSLLRPVEDERRTFILVAEPLPAAPTAIKGLGIGRVEAPSYLKPKAIAIRKGTEIEYSSKYFWAEPVDAGIQRTLAAYLGSSNVFSGAWRRDHVSHEIYVTVDRFEIDERGLARLKASWRITGPGASVILDSGSFEAQKSGPRLLDDPGAATISLSDTLGQLAEEILQRVVIAQSRPKGR